MAKTVSNKEFNDWVDHLRATAPPPPKTTVTVRRVDPDMLKGHAGETLKRRSRFEIQIDKTLSRMETEWTLIHEWAHMLDWRPYRPMYSDHGPTWGVHYSEVYQAFYHTR